MLLAPSRITYNENILMPKKWIICRICLGQNEVMFDIYEKISNFYIWQMLRDCGGVSVRKNDNLPDKICEDCLKELCKSNKFRLKCQRGNRSLINILLERDFNIYEHELNKERAACSNIVEPHDEEEKVAIIQPLNPNKLSYTKCNTSVAELNKPLKTFEDLKILDINDIKIKSDTNESRKSEEIETIGIQSNSVKKHYCIVNNIVKSDTNEKTRIVLLLKVQNQTTSKITTKTKVKSKTQIISQTKSITKERKNSNNVTKTKSKPILKKNIKNEQQTKKSNDPQNKSETKGKPLNTKSGSAAKKMKLAIESETSTKNYKLTSRKTFPCRICKKRFNSDLLLLHHIYTHTKPYQCKVCGKSFSQTHSFKSHFNTHTHEKPFCCRHCHLRFSDASNRNTHERTKHKNECKEYKCRECNTKFRLLSMLEKHLKSHRSSKCKICGKLLSSHQTLRSHHQRKHLKKLMWDEL